MPATTRDHRPAGTVRNRRGRVAWWSGPAGSLAGCLAVLLAGCGSGGRPHATLANATHTTGVERTASGPAAPVSAGMLFSVLDTERTDDDALPSVRSGVPVGGSATLSDNAGARGARRLSSMAWLVLTGDSELCLVYSVKALTPGPTGAPLPPAIVHQCTTVIAAAAGRLVVTQSLSASSRGKSEEVRILGVVPDGVARVSVIEGDGRTTVVPVRRNSYAGTVADPVAVRFSDRVGTSSVSQVVPVASFDSRAAMPTP
jgi:hypothetical protein